jgi:hypothetical protein
MSTDIYILTKKHGLSTVQKLPANYLLSSQGNYKHSRPEVWQFIEDNKELLLTLGDKPMVEEVQVQTSDCAKTKYYSEKFAKEQLNKIINSKGEHKKPVRAYECEYCGQWHLTSMPLSEYKANL